MLDPSGSAHVDDNQTSHGAVGYSAVCDCGVS